MNTTHNESTHTESDRAAIERTLSAAGWVLVHSVVLGQPIVMKRAASVSVSLPERYRDAVVYVFDEVASLVGVAAEDLRILHEFKRVFGGRIHREMPTGTTIAKTDTEETT